ncbi:filamentation induced by cAMP protein Fic [Francisella sp. W12-1067]|nr:filamentation induced by cAMP protein Fic [Francisella sp. W12-1067]
MSKYNFDKIDQLKFKLDSFRPLSEEIVTNIHDNLIVDWTYHSNAIEGNTLTVNETKVVLEGITVGGKSLREHFEAINHKEAILFLEDIVKAHQELSEKMIKDIHFLILKNIDNTNAGKYRNINVKISGAEHIPPSYIHLNELMFDLIKNYKSWNNLHPVEQAAKLHSEFVKIHPFIDGNGRTSRLLMNLVLMQYGYPPAILPISKRLRYYNALDKAHVQNDYTDFIGLIVEIAEESFEPYWFALGV